MSVTIIVIFRNIGGTDAKETIWRCFNVPCSSSMVMTEHSRCKLPPRLSVSDWQASSGPSAVSDRNPLALRQFSSACISIREYSHPYVFRSHSQETHVKAQRGYLYSRYRCHFARRGAPKATIREGSCSSIPLKYINGLSFSCAMAPDIVEITTFWRCAEKSAAPWYGLSSMSFVHHLTSVYLQRSHGSNIKAKKVSNRPAMYNNK